jgi:hypothetical protein
VAGLDQAGGQLASACAKLDNVQRFPTQEPNNRLERIARSAALILVGDPTKRPRALKIDRWLVHHKNGSG